MKKKVNDNNYVIGPAAVIVSSIIPIVLQVAFFVFQAMNGIITIWNNFSTALMLGIFVFAIRTSIIASKKDHSNKDEHIQAKIDSMASNKRSVGVILAQIIMVLVAAALSVFFFKLYEKKSQNLPVMYSVVVSQKGDVTTKTEYTDDGVTTTQSEYVEVTVEYEFDGEKKQAVISSSLTSKVYVEHLKIFVDQDGEFVCDYGRIVVWKFEAFVFAAFAGLMLLVLLFKLGSEFMAGIIFAGISFAILVALSSQLIENFLYNDIICFCTVFANVGIYMITCGVLTALLGKKVKDDEGYNELKTQTAGVTSQQSLNYSEENHEQSETEEQHMYCKSCSCEISPTDKFCQNCGSKIEK